jgi:hypothetical protein
MPKRYDNPQEILKIMRKTELLKQSAERSPFTGILTLFCYTLWKDYKYSQTRLSDFCGKFTEYNEKYENEPYTELQSRLNDFADWTIEYKEFTEADYPHYKSVVAQKCILEQVRCNNLINELSTRYILYGMVILMEDGFSKKKLTNFKDKFSENDIVKINNSEVNTLITFRDFEIICTIPREKYYKHRLEHTTEYEVVGNVFDNPELLEE